MRDLEFRTLAEPIEFRSAGDGGKTLTATGVAIRYGSISKNLGGFHERILAGAVKDPNAMDVRFVSEHDRNNLLGRTSSKTLRFEDSPVDLRYTLDLPDTQRGRDAATMLERRDLTGSSVAMFRHLTKATWSKTDDGLALRSVTSTVLDHVSFTGWNSYDDSTAELALRSLSEDSGIDLKELVKAAAHGDLAELIASPGSDETEKTPDPKDDEEHLTVIHRRPIDWFV